MASETVGILFEVWFQSRYIEGIVLLLDFFKERARNRVKTFANESVLFRNKGLELAISLWILGNLCCYSCCPNFGFRFISLSPSKTKHLPGILWSI